MTLVIDDTENIKYINITEDKNDDISDVLPKTDVQQKKARSTILLHGNNN